MLLGAGYTVNNDGVNGGTVMAGTAKSATSLMGPPNIVIIGPFAEHDYAAGITEVMWQAKYKSLVDAYLALTPAPTVYVMTPPPAAFVYQMDDLEQTFATDVVKPAVLAVAAGGNTAGKTLKVIDLFSASVLTSATDMAGDGHFKPAGHKDVAQLAYKCVAMGMCAGSTTSGTAGTGGGGTGGSTGGAGGAQGWNDGCRWRWRYGGAGGATVRGGTGGRPVRRAPRAVGRRAPRARRVRAAVRRGRRARGGGGGCRHERRIDGTRRRDTAGGPTVAPPGPAATRWRHRGNWADPRRHRWHECSGS